MLNEKDFKGFKSAITKFGVIVARTNQEITVQGSMYCVNDVALDKTEFSIFDYLVHHKLKPGVNMNNKTTYTQEMEDSKTPPLVGMKCQFKHDNKFIEGVVLSVTKQFVVLEDKSGIERIRKLSEAVFKPLIIAGNKNDTTNEMNEALRLETNKKLENEGFGMLLPEISEFILNQIIAGKFKHIKYTGNDSLTK